MTDEPLSRFTRRRVAGLAEDALKQAGVIGALPTPMEAVQHAVGVRERIDISELPDELAAEKPASWRRILGALWFPERIVFIDGSEPNTRQLFTDAHEATHAMCDWHETILRLDNEDTLFRQLHPGVEAEANFGASYLIFQGRRFHKRALRDQVSIRTPLDLARRYGASRHATLHYYAELHPDPVALLIAGRRRRPDGTLPIWRSVESPSFRARHGRLHERLPGGVLSTAEDESGPLAEIVNASRMQTDPPSKRVGIPDGDGTKVTFVAEAFYNQHCQFVLVSDEKARRLGRRLRLAS